MRLVKLRLGASQPFWFLNDIVRLSSDNRESDYINIDSLSDDHVRVIENSARAGYVRLYNAFGSRVFGNLSSSEFVAEEEDLQPSKPEAPVIVDESKMPELVLVTTSKEEESEEEPEDIPLYQEPDVREAKLLLSKNGNTVRATVKKCSKNKRALLYACLDLEKVEKKRVGVIKELTARIESFN